MKKKWISEFIKTKKIKKMSIYRLAKELNVAQQTAYGWDNGRTSPNYENLNKICKLFECTASELLGF